MAQFETWDRETLNRFANECAADNQRLLAENAKLREALQRVCSHGTRTSQQIDADWDFARAALGGE